MTAKTTSLLLLVLLSLTLASPGFVRAIPAEYQQCVQGTSCTIGEFLYDDNYIPITTASCTITSRDPGGTLFINGAAMTANSDGWYSYSVNTVSAVLGIYRTQVCCTAGTDYLCIDKTFNIGNADLTAQDVESAVLDADLADHTTAGTVGEQLGNTSTLDASDIWSYSNRSLTSFGTLISDIWGYTNRSLTSFGTLVASIWSNDERTLTEVLSVDTSNLATKDDINSMESDVTTVINNQTTTLQTTIGGDNTAELQQIQNQIAQNRTILEALLNDPIISSGGDTFDDSTLQTMLELASDYLSQIYANTQQIISRIGLLLLNWDTLTAQEIADELTDILATLGNNPSNDSYSTSIINQLSWFDQNWTNTTTNNAFSTANDALAQLSQVLSQVDINNKNADIKTTLTNALTNLNSSETYIGNLSSPISSSTLYGLLKQYQAMAETLKASDQQLSNLLSNWHTYNLTDLNDQVSSLESTILDINLIPKSNDILSTNGSDDNERLRNKAIALKALINLNQKLLANSGTAPIQTIWLETNDDTILFRSAVFNPSSSESQPHNLKYYLPRELKLDDVLSLSGDINKEYDTNEEKTFIEGSFNLSPRQVLIQQAETTDFWHLPEAELDSIKSQAGELLASLDGTNFYGQGAQLKGDIDVAVALIKERQNRVVTPEDRIMAFRQSVLDMETVRENLILLNDLVTQANTAGSIFGFVGGIQAVAVWGIVLIIIVGVVGITLYMRFLHREEMAVHGVDAQPKRVGVKRPLKSISPSIPFFHQTDRQRTPRLPKTKHDPQQKIFHAVVIGLSSAALAAMAAGSIVKANSDSSLNAAQVTTSQPDPSLMPTTPLLPTSTPVTSQTVAAPPEADNITILGTTDLKTISFTVPLGERYNLRSKPAAASPVVHQLTGSNKGEIIEDTGEWINLHLPDLDLSGWIHQDLITSD